jgi:hypothetical protein
MDEVKIIESSNSKSLPSHPQTETFSRALTGLTRATPKFKYTSQKPLTGHCPAQPNIVWNLNLSRAQQLVSWESSINTPPPLTAQKAWPLHFSVEQAHILYSQRPISLSPRAFIPSSYLEIEWSKDSTSLCDSPPQAHLDGWIFILHTYYSWSIAPR